MEGAATTVYAQGGRGNSRLMAWEGERTVTFTMEDALISPAGFMILSGAGLVEAGAEKPVMVHTTEQVKVTSVVGSTVTIDLNQEPYKPSEEDNNNENYIYVMLLDENGEVSTEPYIPETVEGNRITLKASDDVNHFKSDSIVLVDYYVARQGGVSEITITPDKFGGYYYLEASTLFRNTDGVDMPAEFIIPNCKIQSNFTFTMASSGDPSTFTFTIDAFPDYTRFDKTKKVLAAIQVITEAEGGKELERDRTKSERQADANGMITDTTVRNYYIVGPSTVEQNKTYSYKLAPEYLGGSVQWKAIYSDGQAEDGISDANTIKFTSSGEYVLMAVSADSENILATKMVNVIDSEVAEG